MSDPEHVDGPRAACPGCIAIDALMAEAIAAADEQLATTDSTDGNLAADRLARLILRMPTEKHTTCARVIALCEAREQLDMRHHAHLHLTADDECSACGRDDERVVAIIEEAERLAYYILQLLGEQL